MRRTLALLAVAAAAAAGITAAPASATCMEQQYPGGVRVVSCVAPGGPVTTYVCYRDTCVPVP